MNKINLLFWEDVFNTVRKYNGKDSIHLKNYINQLHDIVNQLVLNAEIQDDAQLHERTSLQAMYREGQESFVATVSEAKPFLAASELVTEEFLMKLDNTEMLKRSINLEVVNRKQSIKGILPIEKKSMIREAKESL